MTTELLTAVLGTTVYDPTVEGTNVLFYSSKYHRNEFDVGTVYSTKTTRWMGEVVGSCPQYFINIYELMHLMKEWLKTKVSNAKSGFDNGHRHYCHIENPDIDDRFYGDTEPEAVTQACLWLLSNK